MTNQRGQNSIICILCRYIYIYNKYSTYTTVQYIYSTHCLCEKSTYVYICVSYIHKVVPQFHTVVTPKKAPKNHPPENLHLWNLMPPGQSVGFRIKPRRWIFIESWNYHSNGDWKTAFLKIEIVGKLLGNCQFSTQIFGGKIVCISKWFL